MRCSLWRPGVSPTGLAGTFGKYVDALEAIWIEYFVAFDDQGQRSLGRSVRSGFIDYQAKFASFIGITTDLAAEWLKDVRGDKGLQASVTAVVYGAVLLVVSVLGILLIIWIIKNIIRSKVWRRLSERIFSTNKSSIIEFYQTLISILEEQGLKRQPFQTPLEFAYAVDLPGVVEITKRYQKVRFGHYGLSRDEANEISLMLEQLKKGGK